MRTASLLALVGELAGARSCEGAGGRDRLFIKRLLAWRDRHPLEHVIFVQRVKRVVVVHAGVNSAQGLLRIWSLHLSNDWAVVGAAAETCLRNLSGECKTVAVAGRCTSGRAQCGWPHLAQLGACMNALFRTPLTWSQKSRRGRRRRR